MSFEPDGVSRKEYDRLIAQVADVMKLRLEDKLAHCNVMGRIAVALFGDQNNRTDEECVARAAEIGYQLTGTQQALFQAQEASKMLASEVAALRDQEEFNETALKGYRNNIDDLKHDIDRHVQIAAERAQEIEELRSDLAAARDEAKISEDALQSACVKALNERDQLRQNLAAARALLREASGWLGDNDAEESLIRRIDAALAGERREGEG